MSNIIPFRRTTTGPKGEYIPPQSVFHVVFEVNAEEVGQFADLLAELDAIEGVTDLSVKRA